MEPAPPPPDADFPIEFRGYERAAVRERLADMARREAELAGEARRLGAEVRRLEAEVRRLRRVAARPSAPPAPALPAPCPPAPAGPGGSPAPEAEAEARRIVDAASALGAHIVASARRERRRALIEAEAAAEALRGEAREVLDQALRCRYAALRAARTGESPPKGLDRALAALDRSLAPSGGAAVKRPGGAAARPGPGA